ncbi:MAG: PPOX class F420-dependent oxidoreductase [Chloroflexota bacterium]|nr:PPOX class F420-dependent oxidoreductase [Chloroflexota bacterium]
MAPKTLSDKARAFLNEKRFAVLATSNADGTIQQTTMWYLLEGDTILMNTKKGRVKERNLRRDQRISICIADGYSYVTIRGTAEIIDNPELGQRDIFRLATRYHGEEKAKRQVAEIYSKDERITLHLKCEHIQEYML